MDNNVKSAEEMMEEILAKLDHIEDLKNMIEKTKMEIDEIIVPMKIHHSDFVAKLSTKTGYKGSFYSFKSRFNDELKRQVHYACKTDKAFGSWRKKENRKKDEGSS